MENNAFHYNSLARTLMGYRKLLWNPGWLLPEEPSFWLFGSLRTIPPSKSLLIQSQQNSFLVCFPRPWRFCMRVNILPI
jgi:hypothetical protein